MSKLNAPYMGRLKNQVAKLESNLAKATSENASLRNEVERLTRSRNLAMERSNAWREQAEAAEAELATLRADREVGE